MSIRKSSLIAGFVSSSCEQPASKQGILQSREEDACTMLSKILQGFAWLYWYINYPFVAAFAETVLGYGEGEYRVHGERITAQVTKFLHEVPPAVFLQFAGALALLPLYSPPRLAKSNIRRVLQRFWYGLKSFFSHGHFLLLSKDGRTRMVDQMFAQLIAIAPEEEYDAIKTIVTFSLFRWTLAIAYLDQVQMWQAIGYEPVRRRTFDPPTGPNLADPPVTPASTMLHDAATTAKAVAAKPPGKRTYCIVGSGAGGAAAADAIQEVDPQARIVILEGGPLFANTGFSRHALPALSSAYMNGGITLSSDEQFIFLQGRGVGGSTLVYNSVAFKPEGFWWQNIKNSWQALGVELDYDDLYHQYDVLGKKLHVVPVGQDIITKGARTVRAGWEKMYEKDVRAQWQVALAEDDPVVVAHTNSIDCIGCGRCNLGCQYGSKQSMAESLLPEFVRRGGLLVPNSQATRLEFAPGGGGMKAVAVWVTDSEGNPVRIEADRVILAAGAYASTKLLWRSGFTGNKRGVRTVGKRLSVNAGSPLIGILPDQQGPFDGQQIGFALEIPELRMVAETGSAPPGIIALQLPQWGANFQRVMRRVNNFVAAVPVWGTSAYGEIKRGFLGDSGFVIDFSLVDEDWRKLEQGLKICAKAMFNMGAEEVFVNRFNGTSMTRVDQINDYFDGIGPSDFISVQSGHIQGGNVMASAESRGVVDNHSKVFGMENVWICDASVIPAPITLNIALTVMALSRYSALRIARN